MNLYKMGSKESNGVTVAEDKPLKPVGLHMKRFLGLAVSISVMITVVICLYLVLSEQKSQKNGTQDVIINGLREQMMEDIKSGNWDKSVYLMKIFLDHNTQAYRQLNNITVYYNYPAIVARMGCAELLQIMIYNGLPINIRYVYNNYTMLYYAAEYRQYDVLELLIKKGADLNLRDFTLSTPLHEAAWYGYENIVQLLVEGGADINIADNNGSTPLHLAAEEGYENIVQLLIESGADINAADNYGNSPLDRAAMFEHNSVEELLRAKGYDATGDKVNESAKIGAEKKNEKQGFSTVFINGLQEQMMDDIKSGYFDKSVALMKSHLYNNTQAYKQLNNFTFYYLLPLKVGMEGYIELMKVILYNGLPINTGFDNFPTMLHWSALYGQYDIVKFLIKQGADLNVRNSFNNTPLHFAAAKGHLNVVQMLIERGADINATNGDGDTALHLAAYWRIKSVEQWLVDNGCDTTIRNKDNKTAMDQPKPVLLLTSKY